MSDGKVVLELVEMAKKTNHFQDELIMKSNIPEDEKIKSVMMIHCIAFAVSLQAAFECLKEPATFEEHKKHWYDCIDLIIEDLIIN